MPMIRKRRYFLAALIVLVSSVIFNGCNASPAPRNSPAASTGEATVQASKLPPSQTEPALPATQPVQAARLVPTQGPYLPAVPVWGIETYYLGADDPGLNLIKQSGAYWVRRNALLWSDVEPTLGARNWEMLTGLEGELKAAAAQNLHTILVVRSTPDWAQSLPGSLCSPPSPESLEAFGAFLHEAVRRYSVPPYNVQYWEIGNEPDVASGLVASDAPFGCWGQAGDPTYGGGYYAEILKIAYPQIKSANPQAQVLAGGLLLDCDPVNPPETQPGSGQAKDCSPARYLEGVLAAGGGAYFDGISFHAYDYYAQKPGEYNNANWNSAWNSTGPTLIAKANYLRGLLNLYGITGKYLMNTEAALLCGRDGSEPECQSEDYQLTKSYLLAESYISAIAEHLTANVWYSLTGWRASGLVDGNMQPNLAYQALAASVERLGGAGYRGQITDYPGVRGFAFERNGSPLWVLWSLDGNEHSIQLDQAPASVTDVFGNKLGTDLAVQVSRAPIYIELAGK